MNALQYDGQIDIAVGASRRSVNWKNQQMLWSDLVQRLSVVSRTTETAKEYKSLPKPKRDEIKDVGGFVGGTLKGGRRKAEAIQERRVLTLDLDYVTQNDKPWETICLVLGCAAVIYSTHSYTETAQRLRLVMPLSRPVTPDEYTAVSRRIAGDVGIDLFDDTTYEPHRLMYWPSASLDAPYVYEYQDGPWLDVDEQLARYKDWTDTSEWPVSSRKTDIMQRLAKKQGDPTEKPGIVGAFCRVYDVPAAIEQFLPEVYTPAGEDRYTYVNGSTAGGLVIYENGKFAYSHHATDPISGKLCNAFDLVRLHMFGEHDDDAAPGTPPNRLPSHQMMSDIAIEDNEVRTDLTRNRIQELSDKWDDVEADDLDWVGQLSVNSKGAIESTIDNVYIILLNDPAIKGKYIFDEFKERPVVTGDLPWITLDRRPSDSWNDVDDAGLRRHLEKTYQVDNFNKIKDAVDLAMNASKRHPVREYLQGLVWDGVPRMDSIFIDYLGAEDSTYTRQVTRKSLIGAVARIFRPGCKHDHMLVLVGPQGCRKSTTIAKLGKTWFSDSLYTLGGKEAYEQLQGYWIIEMGEMAATRKAELEQIKQFMSKQSDNFRSAYARRTQEHPRQCCFFGTTNDEEFLRDPTGGRRFWPVTVTDVGKSEADKLDESTVDQIWAEAVVRYESGENWYLGAETEAIAKRVQEEHTEMNSKQGLIEEFLETMVPDNWDEMGLDERLVYLGADFGEAQTGTKLRDRVCAIEIWQELFKGDPKTFSQANAREINGILRRVPGWVSKSSVPCGLYGRQRAFIREGSTLLL